MDDDITEIMNELEGTLYTPEVIVKAEKPALRRSTRWNLPAALLVVGSLLVSACTPVRSIIEEPTPQQQEQGTKYREDIVSTAREFIGHHYQSHEISFDNDRGNLWTTSFIENQMISFVYAGPNGKQSFLIANTYGADGRIEERHISAGSGPVWNIHLPSLPGESISPESESGHGPIPFNRLQELAGALFNLPSGLEWNVTDVCYTLPGHIENTPPNRSQGLVATGRIADGRFVRLRIASSADALLLVTDPSLGESPVPAVC